MRIFNVVGAPFAGYVRVAALSLWRRAKFQRRQRNLAGFVCVGALLLQRRANLQCRWRTLCADRACPNTLAQAPWEFLTCPLAVFGGCSPWRVERPASVLRILVKINDTLAVLDGRRRWRVERPENSRRNPRPWSIPRLLLGIDYSLAVFGRGRRWCVERPDYYRKRRPYVFWADSGADAWSVLRIMLGIDDLLVVLGRRRWRMDCPENYVWKLGNDDHLVVFSKWRRWRVERFENSLWNQRPRPATLAWSVLRTFFGIRDPLAALGRRQHWCEQRPEISRCNRRPSCCFGRAAVLRPMGILRIMSKIDDHFAVFGRWQHWRGVS